MFICVAMYVCQGKAMLAYTTHLPWKQEENERLRGEGDQIKFIDLTFESCRTQESKKEARQSTNLTLQGTANKMDQVAHLSSTKSSSWELIYAIARQPSSHDY